MNMHTKCTVVLRVTAYLIQYCKLNSTYFINTEKTFNFEDDLFSTSTRGPMKT